MPNIVTNRLVLTGEPPAVAAALASIGRSEVPVDFGVAVPEPDEPDVTGLPFAGRLPDWHVWRSAFWGTKWNADGPEQRGRDRRRGRPAVHDGVRPA